MKIRSLVISLAACLIFVFVCKAHSLDLGDEGCPMAHCDPQMSDNSKLPPPKGKPVDIVWTRNQLSGESVGSSWGVGCSSNGEIAACSYRGESDNLVVYDFDGNRIYASGRLLNKEAWKSAPLIDRTGKVVACDDTRIIMVDTKPRPAIVWQTALPKKAPPISPVITRSGVIVLATLGGPVSAYDSVTGKLLGSMTIKAHLIDPRIFETVNTPASRGDRIYISTQLEGVRKYTRGMLVAVDVDPTPGAKEVLKVAWSYEFDAPSGASPTVINDTIYFDGFKKIPGRGEVPYIFAITDRGDYWIPKWEQEISDQLQASCARDPRGGIWDFPSGTKWLEHRDEINGHLIEKIDVDQLVDDKGRHIPFSAMTIAGDQYQPVMVVAAAVAGSPQGKHYIIAIDLKRIISPAIDSNNSISTAIDLNNSISPLLWRVAISDEINGFTAGQFPIMVKDGRSRVVFSSYSVGARAIGEINQSSTSQGKRKE